MTFETSLSQFDRDFPGHYMRLVKNVSMTVIALIPPTKAIHATLSNNGLSRVMVGPPFNEPRVIQRQPESIAVSVASNGTGLFELRLDDPILLPFESSGVETVWELQMPKAANRFDYETLIDIYFTIRYTALDDPSYRSKVIKQLGDTVSSTASYSMRNAFPDAWYDFNNPIFLDDISKYGYEEGKVRWPYTLQFELKEADFPPNESVQNMVRLNLAFNQTKPLRMSIEIEFQPDGSEEEYLVEVDYDWDPKLKVLDKGPISLTKFTYKFSKEKNDWEPVEQLLADFDKKKVTGRWRLRINNRLRKIDKSLFKASDYPGLYSANAEDDTQNKLNIEGLKDVLFVVTYVAKVDWGKEF